MVLQGHDGESKKSKQNDGNGVRSAIGPRHSDIEPVPLHGKSSVSTDTVISGSPFCLLSNEY